MGKILFLAYLETLRTHGMGGGLAPGQEPTTAEEQWNNLRKEMQQFWEDVAIAVFRDISIAIGELNATNKRTS